MAGRFTLRTKILGSLDNAHAKHLLPETIDRHARGQRMTWIQ